MFILKSKHEAAIAAKDTEAEGMARRLRLYAAALKRIHRDNVSLRAQLARYTAPRERGEGGRFLPLKRVS